MFFVDPAMQDFESGFHWPQRTFLIGYCQMCKLQLALVFSIFLYACETWTLTVKLQRNITAVEMRCYRWLLGISYTEHVTNDEVRRWIEEQIGPIVHLLTAVKRRKLRWYGHVTRPNCQLLTDYHRQPCKEPYKGEDVEGTTETFI